MKTFICAISMIVLGAAIAGAESAADQLKASAGPEIAASVTVTAVTPADKVILSPVTGLPPNHILKASDGTDIYLYTQLLNYSQNTGFSTYHIFMVLSNPGFTSATTGTAAVMTRYQGNSSDAGTNSAYLRNWSNSGQSMISGECTVQSNRHMDYRIAIAVRIDGQHEVWLTDPVNGTHDFQFIVN